MTSDGIVADTTRPDSSWRRLDRRMLVVQPLEAFGHFLPAIVVVLVAGGTGSEAPWWTNLWVVVLPPVLGVWAWFTTEYRITREQLTLRRGLVSRKTLTARLDRIRTVDVTASLLQRLLGLAAVKVGTGTETPFVLPGLAAADAHALRAQLLHVAREERGEAAPGPNAAGSGAPADGAAPGPMAPPPAEETALAVFSPSWVRFAPFTLTGLVTVLAGVGAIAQFLDDLGERIVESDLGHSAIDHVLGLTTTMLVVGGVGLGLALVVVAALVSYVLRFWGYRLTRHPRGTLGISRGLLSTRHMTMEERRLRGVSLERPFLLRLVGGARASALVTGLSGATEQGSASDMLVPPAPLEEVRRVVADVLRAETPWQATLRAHGPRARRRRHTRALAGGLLLAVPAVLAVWWFELAPALLALAAVPVLVAPFLAESRYRRLGHTVVDGHLVSRVGLFPETTDVVRTSAIIGWNVDETFMQRRLGLVTLAATIAAGDDSIGIPDVPLAEAEAVVRCATPGLAEQFMDRA
ncbi:PH domain-containing protein [Mobilicoccus pelagius]|uniref:YdbS-like PH domain-containing protein n=1 Tax=Mobilicoccus pelagius NBRC 104925 TaxID=1089455 RepID=H5USI8_9MICO|nr:PH domain-containing protein [Mobilicoccus pelagius]GAB48696.1 hypothetical protein MOPEL_078_00850 [Mobilicoccus pelagius NBRC 104925]